jgi:hypothetical protein
MSEEEVELVTEDVPAYFSYLEQVSLEEMRRYIALDMARLVGATPDKLVKHSREIERFLAGNLPELARSNDN